MSRLVSTSTALAEEIIARDLPDVGPERRAAAVRQVGRAVAALPDSVRPGVAVAGRAVLVRRRWAGERWLDTDLPVLREYVRLVRGLALAAACEAADAAPGSDTGPHTGPATGSTTGTTTGEGT